MYQMIEIYIYLSKINYKSVREQFSNFTLDVAQKWHAFDLLNTSYFGEDRSYSCLV